jgi:hypothetical protein
MTERNSIIKEHQWSDVITMWGEEEEASLWRDRETGTFLDAKAWQEMPRPRVRRHSLKR